MPPFKDAREQSDYLVDLMMPRIDQLRREIAEELRLLDDLAEQLSWGHIEIRLVSTLPLAWDHEAIEQDQIEGRLQQVLAIENGVVNPGDPEYNEEVAECHIHQTDRRLRTSSD